MKVNTNIQQQAASMLEQSPCSPLKARKDNRARARPSLNNRFSHFSRRMSGQVSDSNCFYMRINQCNELAAVSMFDGSIKIFSTMVGDTIFDIKDNEMTAPITSLSWKTVTDEEVSKQTLLGACLNGSIVRWNSSMGNNVEHISLNERNRFHAIDCSTDLRRFCVAGSEPYIEIYDETRMTQVQQIGDRVLKPAHSNKIFTCKFNPQAPNMIYSGSWDR